MKKASEILKKLEADLKSGKRTKRKPKSKSTKDQIEKLKRFYRGK